MKKSGRLLCALLCALMLLPLIVACGKTPIGVGEDTGSGVVIGGDDTTAGTEEKTSVFTPSERKYDGADYTALVAGPADTGEYHIFKEVDEDPTVVNQAVSKKNAAVAQQYDVTIKYIDGFKNAQTLIKDAYMAGDSTYSICFADGYSVVPMAYQGNLYNIKSMKGINLENEWWDQNANADLELNGLMFFTTGDIDIWDDLQQYVMMFNKTLFDKSGLDTDSAKLYSTVGEGKWTWDKLYSLGKNLTKELDGNDTMNDLDQYGMLTWDDTIYAVFSSCGAKIVENDGKKLTLAITSDETAIKCMTDWTEFTKENGYNYSRDGGGSKGIKMFMEDRALFFLGRLQSLGNFRNMESTFGLLPIPKFTEDQDEYKTACSAYHMSFVCFVNNETDIDMRADVAEALAYYSRQFLTPAYQEKTLEGQTVRDDGSLDTLKIIAAKRIYDIGFCVQPNSINKELIYLYRAWSSDFASMYARVAPGAEQALDEINTGYAEAAKDWAQQ